ncbi:uncharacterized protein RAG0_10624 [Rhynchosporium agropyri]|uniref:Uncharacterized protein n=1 Tax=Rhynchosporium agropyri TaxID=914238 RepID=A0A1E1L0K3_9HELO|nr:uncharacterized protein RAG0_10624 [Rhynchosporium agropyri]
MADHIFEMDLQEISIITLKSRISKDASGTKYWCSPACEEHTYPSKRTLEPLRLTECKDCDDSDDGWAVPWSVFFPLSITLKARPWALFLRIKFHALGNTREHEDYHIQIGDYIRLLDEPTKDRGRVVPAKNLRTGDVGHIIWMSVFPLKKREICYCLKEFQGKCGCVYTDFEKSREG